MKNYKHIGHILISFSLLSFSPQLRSQSQVALTKEWESEPGLKVPESVIYDAPNKIIYVANINGKSSEKDGNGFISKLSTTGKIIDLEWITGLDAPKGMGIFNNKLYVTDITRIAIIDIPTGKIDKYIDVKDAIFLNDITIDSKGNVYISDSSNKKIYILQGNEAVLWFENAELKKPNGLLALEKKLMVIDMDGGYFYELGYNDKKLNAIAQNIPAGDGIVQISKDEYLISNWNGEINYIKNKRVDKLLDTKNEKINAADIWYIEAQKLVIVPTFFGNSVVAYKLKF